ncbi:MAG: hypothetical protein D3903_22035 [Candidatus Electrothrix sp. GM3_4]|nr:hypothetical protein [Candidatus Electrothrix sp. GM3_4]
MAPIMLQGIPQALLCVGTLKKRIFSEIDRQLVCTFVDAISEFFRLERAVMRAVESKKVVVLGFDSELDAKLQELIEGESCNQDVIPDIVQNYRPDLETSDIT